MDKELTDREIERIDLLHNETNDYLARIIPGYDPENWDIGLIDRVVEAVWNEIKDRGWMTEREFYPYRDDPDDDDGDEDPSAYCGNFCWADAALADDHPVCCRMCGHSDEDSGKCNFGRASA